MPHRPMALESYDLPLRNREYLIPSCSLIARVEPCVNIDGEPGAYRKAHAGFGEGHLKTRGNLAGESQMPTLRAEIERTRR
jgi:hypothetical protein